MNGCFGCFALMVLLFFAMLAIGFVATYWAPIMGLSLAYASSRYIKAIYKEG